MQKWTTWWVLLLLTAGAVWWVMYPQPADEDDLAANEVLFPNLRNLANPVAKISVQSAKATFDLNYKDGVWRVSSHDDYPAEPNTVFQWLLGTSELRRLERKTSNPDLYVKLGLNDPADDNSRAVQFIVTDGAENKLAEYVLGDRVVAKGDTTRSEYFVRVPGNPETWLVDGKLPAGLGEPLDWVSQELVTISPERIRQVVVTHPDGETVTVSKTDAKQPDFILGDLPENAVVGDDWRVNDIGKGLSDLRFDDVQARGEVSEGEVGYTVVLVTFDGLQVTMETTRSGERTLGTLEAAFARSESDETEGETTTSDDLRSEVNALNQRWENWVFILPKYQSDYFSKRRSDLFTIKTEEASGG